MTKITTLYSALRAFEQEWGLYRATPAVTRGLGFSSLIIRTFSINCFLRLAKGCRGPILTWILTGSHSVASYDTRVDTEGLFFPGSSWVCGKIICLGFNRMQMFCCLNCTINPLTMSCKTSSY
jgi:hypothetical protein